MMRSSEERKEGEKEKYGKRQRDQRGATNGRD